MPGPGQLIRRGAQDAGGALGLLRPGFPEHRDLGVGGELGLGRLPKAKLKSIESGLTIPRGSKI